MDDQPPAAAPPAPAPPPNPPADVAEDEDLVQLRRALRPKVPRWIRWYLGFAVLLCVLMVLGLWVVPRWLDRTGHRFADQANEQLRRCRNGLDAAASAEARFAALEWFPGYALAAENGRRALLFKVINGVAVCSQSGLPPAGFVDPVLAFVLDRLPAAVDRSPGGDRLRFEAEEKLHRLGRDREIVALAARLPKGGQVTERVRAHLHLGDVAGAAAVWREPGARPGPGDSEILSRGVVLCLAGDFEAALPALEERRRDFEIRSADVGEPRRGAHLFAHAECARRAGRPDVLHAVLAEMRGLRSLKGIPALFTEAPPEPPDDSAAVEDPPSFGGDTTRLDWALLRLAAAVRGGSWEAVWAEAQWDELGHRLRKMLVYRSGEEIWNPIYFPPCDAAILTAAARVLAGASGPQAAAAKHSGAGLLTLAALQLGRRWDPGADALIDEALALDPANPAPENLRTALRFFHGEAVPGSEWQAEYDRARTAEPPRDRFSGYALLLGFPDGYEVTGVLAALDAAKAEPAQKLEVLRWRATEGGLLGAFFRLTNLVVVGRRLGTDVKPWEEQLAALRAMVDREPNLRLLQGLPYERW